ncbi:MAG TPA: hypothetical protein VHA07_12140 [Devosia sp.]|nr:hypothetical protein [Devosia sp.]
MSPEKPISPWKLTPPRILLLALGALALLFIAGSLLGVRNYEALRESLPSSSSQARAG